jgi:hypothetical protein
MPGQRGRWRDRSDPFDIEHPSTLCGHIGFSNIGFPDLTTFAGWHDQGQPRCGLRPSTTRSSGHVWPLPGDGEMSPNKNWLQGSGSLRASCRSTSAANAGSMCSNCLSYRVRLASIRSNFLSRSRTRSRSNFPLPYAFQPAFDGGFSRPIGRSRLEERLHRFALKEVRNERWNFPKPPKRP